MGWVIWLMVVVAAYQLVMGVTEGGEGVGVVTQADEDGASPARRFHAHGRVGDVGVILRAKDGK